MRWGDFVLCFDAGLCFPVLFLHLFGFFQHSFDLIFGEPTRVIGDGDLILIASGLVLSGHVENSIGVDVEGDFDLRDTTRSRGDAYRRNSAGVPALEETLHGEQTSRRVQRGRL